MRELIWCLLAVVIEEVWKNKLHGLSIGGIWPCILDLRVGEVCPYPCLRAVLIGVLLAVIHGVDVAILTYSRMTALSGQDQSS